YASIRSWCWNGATSPPLQGGEGGLLGRHRPGRPNARRAAPGRAGWVGMVWTGGILARSGPPALDTIPTPALPLKGREKMAREFRRPTAAPSAAPAGSGWAIWRGPAARPGAGWGRAPRCRRHPCALQDRPAYPRPAGRRV